MSVNSLHAVIAALLNASREGAVRWRWNELVCQELKCKAPLNAFMNEVIMFLHKDFD